MLNFGEILNVKTMILELFTDGLFLDSEHFNILLSRCILCQKSCFGLNSKRENCHCIHFVQFCIFISKKMFLWRLVFALKKLIIGL